MNIVVKNGQTSWRQKALLVILGLLLSLLILEGVLRAGGWLWNLNQARRNTVDLSEEEVRILCLGESTTALGGENSYPSQLQAILTQERPDIPFRVINRGRVSMTTREILNALGTDLQVFKPHIVVTMMGINDKGAFQAETGRHKHLHRLLDHTRVYGFFRLLWQHLSSHPSPEQDRQDLSFEDHVQRPYEAGRVDSGLTSEAVLEMIADLDMKILRMVTRLGREPDLTDAERAQLNKELGKSRMSQSWLLVHAGWQKRMRQEYPAAMTFFRRAIEVFPPNYGAYVELGRCYAEQGQCEPAMVLYNRASEVAPGAVLTEMEKAECLKKSGEKDQVYAVYQQLLQKQESQFRVNRLMGEWFLAEGYLAEAEQALQRAKARHEGDDYLLGLLAELYAQKGESRLAEQYHREQKALQEENQEVHPQTVMNYRALARDILRQDIRLICMQYPLRSINPLKAILPDQEDDVDFLGHEQEFAQAIQADLYAEYFSDSFAGDFGHCTAKGNRIIARNLADAILSRYPEQGKGADASGP